MLYGILSSHPVEGDVKDSKELLLYPLLAVRPFVPRFGRFRKRLGCAVPSSARSIFVPRGDDRDRRRYDRPVLLYLPGVATGYVYVTAVWLHACLDDANFHVPGAKTQSADA